MELLHIKEEKARKGDKSTEETHVFTKGDAPVARSSTVTVRCDLKVCWADTSEPAQRERPSQWPARGALLQPRRPVAAAITQTCGTMFGQNLLELKEHSPRPRHSPNRYISLPQGMFQNVPSITANNSCELKMTQIPSTGKRCHRPWAAMRAQEAVWEGTVCVRVSTPFLAQSSRNPCEFLSDKSLGGVSYSDEGTPGGPWAGAKTW